MDGIFISYRRDDSAGYAGRLYDRLVAHFGAERVFMDVEGIEPGLDFVEAIEVAVGSCRVLIAVIGDEWTTTTDASGRRRLDDPNDFIRLETGSALQRGIRVVPVLVGGAVMPLATDLPEELKSLTRRQAIEINHKQWEASTGELIRTLEGILKMPAADAATEKNPVSSPVLPTAPGALDSSGHGNRRRLIWLAAIIVGTIATAGLWIGLGQNNTDSETVKEVQGSRPEVPVAVAPTAPISTPSAPVVSEAVQVMPEAIRPPQKSQVEPEPATAPAIPVVLPAPVIREFRVDSSASRTRLCYRVSQAEIVTLLPYPGEVSKVEADCIEVQVTTATTFTLTARNGDRVTRKRLAVAPKPLTASVLPESSPRPDAAVGAATMPGPASRTATVESSRLPIKGERWAYRSSGKWPTSPKRRFEIVAQSVVDGVVTDELHVTEPGRAGEVRRSRGNNPDFIAWNAIGTEFSPYFGAYVALAEQKSLSGFPTPDTDSQWTQWYSKAAVVGQESVSVPAGTFNAFKVEVSSSRAQTGSFAQMQIEPVRIRYLIWYVPQVKRYVRMQRSIKAADGSESENDIFELVSHRLP